MVARGGCCHKESCCQPRKHRGSSSTFEPSSPSERRHHKESRRTRSSRHCSLRTAAPAQALERIEAGHQKIVGGGRKPSWICSARQRCLAHRMRNLAVKVPTDLWPEFKARASACYQAPSRAIARDLAKGIRADYGTLLPSAVACFEDDFQACIAHLRLPVTHRRSTRTTNLLERLFVEERRRLKIIPNGFGEK